MKFSLILLLFMTFTVVKAQDTSETAQFLNVTRYRLKPLELGLHKDINSDKVYLKIYKNIKGSIVEDYKFFKPKKLLLSKSIRRSDFKKIKVMNLIIKIKKNIFNICLFFKKKIENKRGIIKIPLGKK